MTFLTEPELTQARADVASMLPDTAVIQQVTRTGDGAGGWTEEWTPVTGGTVACRLDPIQGASATEVMEIAAGEKTIVTYRLTLPYDAPLTEDRRVITDGNTYEVIQLSTDHSWRVSVKATVSEVR